MKKNRLLKIVFQMLLILSLASGFLAGGDRTASAAGLQQSYTCPCSIWSPAPVVANHTAEALPVELGVKFRTDVSGWITAIRFYKSVNNTGEHYGHLWSNDGTRLAEVFFTNESAEGWQEAILATPVAITAGTTYIASYHTTTGKWSYTPGGFSSEVYNEPLRALASSAELPGNGVYKYGSSGSFPTESYNSTNYWVDVVFNTTVGPDTTPPQVSLTSPASGTFDVPRDTHITIRFNEAMDPNSIILDNLILQDGSGTQVARAVSYTSGNYTAVIDPAANLAYLTTYTVVLKGGQNGVKDLAGNWLAEDYSWSFTTISQDTTPPTVSLVTPAVDATGVEVNSNISVTFSEAMNPTSITLSNLELRHGAGEPEPGGLTYTAGTYTALFNPESNLAYATTYTVVVKGGSGGVMDLFDNRMTADYTWSFTTADPPPPPADEGPGGPILVVATAGDPFGRYYTEILLTEGLNEFNVTDITNVNADLLDDYDVVILAQVALTAGQVDLLSGWVTAGGNLIAMRPDSQLADLLGLQVAPGRLPAVGQLYAYLKVDTTQAPGAGIVGEAIQYHGIADLYTLDGAMPVANLYSNASTATEYPAVSVRSVGENGGQAAAFSYDLARSVVYTRQGNPAWAGQNRDPSDPSVSRTLAHDMYYGNATFDPQPDYIDFNKITIPQADEQQRLLANLIQFMNRDNKPLPRFWYFPRMEKAVVIMTGDDHATGGTAGRFNHYLAISPPGCSVEDWECIRASSYIWLNNLMNDTQAAAFTAAGFEIGYHINTNCVDWTPEALDNFYSTQLATFATAFPSLPLQASQRTHCVTWSDWASQPLTQQKYGLRLDTNYYYYPPAWVNERPGMFTGSGMLMRFADLDGNRINVYQAVTQMTDESSYGGYGSFNPAHINTLLGNAVGPQGYYGAFTANMHTDSVTHAGSETIINAAVSRSVPVISARQMVTWLDGRNASSFEDINRFGDTVTFSIQKDAAANGLYALMPARAAAGDLSALTRDRAAVNFTLDVIKGIEYAVFPATAGSYAVTYTPDEQAPVISQVSAVPDMASATIQWTTDEKASSRVEYGTTPESLLASVTSSSLVTTHQLSLTGLTANTLYHYRVSSTDEWENTAVWPPLSEPPASFITPTGILVDTTVADFSAGTAAPSTYVFQVDDGEVKLAPSVGEEFTAPQFPSGWFSAQYPLTGSGGTNIIQNGIMTIDGTRVGTNALFGPGHTLEFVAAFTGGPHQHIGFGVDFNMGPWAIFSTNSDGTLFQARTNFGEETVSIDTTLSGNWFGVAHHFRIDWQSDSVVYFIDGNEVARHSGTFTNEMHVMAAEYTAGTYTLTLDWLHLSPYPASGEFVSRVFDALGDADWGSISWLADTPAGTDVAISVRTGDTPLPDESWSEFTPVSYGGPVGRNSRYLQYRANLTTNAPSLSPVLKRVALAFNAIPDITPPQISSRTPLPGAINVPLTVHPSVTFNEPMNPASFTTATFSMRATGSQSDVSAQVTYSGLTATLIPNAVLVFGTGYTITLDKSISDLSGNPIGTQNITWQFQTAANGEFIDNVSTDFRAGAFEGVYLAETTDGEVILAPTVGEEFFGDTLPGDWISSPYSQSGTGGTNVVAGGVLTLDGRRAGTSALFTSGRWLEFSATFTPGPYQHIGFGIDYSEAPWAIFSTTGTGTTFYARTSSHTPDTELTTAWANTRNRYRIEWNSNTMVYFINGSQVASHAHTWDAGTTARPLLADYGVGGPVVTVDWIRMGPYASAGTFTSRVFDASKSVIWSTLTSDSSIPTSAELTFQTRSGNTPAPDETWSEWQALGSLGEIASPEGRYLQYQALFTTTDTSVTPTLERVAIGYALPTASVPLVSGWNLVSLPLEPLNSSPAAVLAGLGLNYDIVYAWDTPSQKWLIHDRRQPEMADTLKSMNSQTGYWVHLTAASPQELTVQGTRPLIASIWLHPGWNLVAYPGGSPAALPGVLTEHGVPLEDLGLVYAQQGSPPVWKIYDPALGPEHPANTLTHLEPGWGYWIWLKGTVDREWTPLQ